MACWKTNEEYVLLNLLSSKFGQRQERKKKRNQSNINLENIKGLQNYL